jgi:hypothetical protein
MGPGIADISHEPSRMVIIASRRKLESVSAPRQSRLAANSAAAIAAHSVVRYHLQVGRRACRYQYRALLIALNAVQVSVNPCTVSVLPFRDNRVRFIPIVFSCPPKRHRWRPKPVCRLLSGEATLEVRWGHGLLLSVSRLLWHFVENLARSPLIDRLDEAGGATPGSSA